jgi:hypothetical protein
VARFAQHPEYLDDTERVSSADVAIYTRVADHGLLVAGQLFRTRGDKEAWRSTAERLIFEFRATILYGGGFACDTYEPEFIEFVSESLNSSRAEFCVAEERQPWWRRIFGGEGQEGRYARW